MNWIRSSFCSGGACVEVRLEHGAVYVRAAKQTRPDGQHWGPVQVWTLEEWRGLLRCVKVGWRPDGVYELVGGCVEFGLDRHDDKHIFDADEWKAFTEGVINEEFEPEKLSSPAGGFRGSEPSAGRVVEPPAQLDQAATGAEVDRRDTAPVAAQPLDDELDLLISSAPAVAEERPVTGDRSEAGTGTSPGPVPAAEPRVWMLPPDPGDEVTAVRDFEGDEWRRSGELWTPSDESFKLYWHQLVLEFGPLTDATPAPVVPTDGAS